MVCPYCGHKTHVVNSRPQKRQRATWRRRACINCGSIFTTIEQVQTDTVLVVSKKNSLEPFSRDKLFLSVYDSLKHRKTALSDATNLTATIWSKLSPHIDSASIDSLVIVEVAAAVLERFDRSAATHYRAFHPLQAK